MEIFDMKSFVRIWLIALLILPVAGQNQAAPSAPRKPVPIGMEGPIDFLSLKQGRIVVMDFARRLAPGYQVVDSSGKERSAFNLRPGTRVRLELDARGQVRRITILK